MQEVTEKANMSEALILVQVRRLFGSKIPMYLKHDEKWRLRPKQFV